MGARLQPHNVDHLAARAIDYAQAYSLAGRRRARGEAPRPGTISGLKAEVREWVEVEAGDLVIVSQATAGVAQQAAWSQAIAELVSTATCPVMVLPLDYQHRPVRHLMYLSSAETSAEPAWTHTFSSVLAQRLEARLSCTQITPRPHRDWYRMEHRDCQGNQTETKPPSGVYHFPYENFEQGLSKLIIDRQVDVLALQQGQSELQGWLRVPVSQHRRTAQARLPLLVLPD